MVVGGVHGKYRVSKEKGLHLQQVVVSYGAHEPAQWCKPEGSVREGVKMQENSHAHQRVWRRWCCGRQRRR